MSTAKERASRWIRPEFLDAAAYHVADVGDVIKLDANESPYEWPEEIKEAWLERLAELELNRYPDAPASALCDVIRTTWKIPEQFDILVGNGSDECIGVVTAAVGGPGRIIMAPTPTFVVYQNTAELFSSKFVGVPLAENFALDATVMIDAVKQHDPACIFFAWPNNPTGNLFDRDAMEEVIAATDGLVVVDEAYGAFSNQSFINELDRYPNVVIMRTLSKIGMAGLRLGVLFGDPAWITQFHKVRMPYNVNSLSQASAIFALENESVFARNFTTLNSERELLMQRVSAISGLEVFASDANFFLVRVVGEPGVATVHSRLLIDGIAVKNFHRPSTPLDSCLRISVGKPEENVALVESLATIMTS